MIITVQEELTRAQANGATFSDSFEGASRSADINNLQVGDVLSFPDSFVGKVGKDKQFRDAQFVIVPCKDKNGADTARRVYVSVFTKNAIPYEEKNGEMVVAGDRVYATGTAVDKFKSVKGTLHEQMSQFVGKQIKVSSMKDVITTRFGAAGFRTTQIPTLDLVD